MLYAYGSGPKEDIADEFINAAEGFQTDSVDVSHGLVGAYNCYIYITSFALQALNKLYENVVQLSVTIGIMLAYWLGLFANWRILAILGISRKHSY
ncbi:sugar transporter ERD6-like 6 [Artemisia annua]|uniref:Sugar transporter ERD6-like 6 n=1 Tax=Artemisia annua TaxID=35608 RepID=A0A2U1LX03_ARTAN|nr:sugar transporter ERD6-like 6 [Artemisia annua]